MGSYRVWLMNLSHTVVTRAQELWLLVQAGTATAAEQREHAQLKAQIVKGMTS